MITIQNSNRGKKIEEHLFKSFSSNGILGKKDMPEDSLPRGMTKGSLEHLMFTTLTVSIDYQRDANSLWHNSRITFEDPDTRYLLDPEEVTGTWFEKIEKIYSRLPLTLF